MIVYACKDSQYIVPAVQSARSWMPEEPVLVVDSDSTDVSYFAKVESLGATVADAHNRNYETGAWWAAYQHSDATYFWFLHDSTVLTRSLATWEAQPVTIPGTLKHWTGCNGDHVRRIAHYCTHSGYTVPNPYTGVFGSMFGCQRGVLDTLVAQHPRQCLPTNKFDSECMERLWGIALTNVGVDVPACMWGPYERMLEPSSPVRKFMARRP